MFVDVYYATYVVFFFGIVRLASPHFRQLCLQSSRYFFSSSFTTPAACWQSSLCSMQPDSLHNFEIRLQHCSTSSGLKATRFVLTSKQSSLARTQVRMYLNLCKIFFLNLFLLNSKHPYSKVCISFLVA